MKAWAGALRNKTVRLVLVIALAAGLGLMFLLSRDRGGPSPKRGAEPRMRTASRSPAEPEPRGETPAEEPPPKKASPAVLRIQPKGKTHGPPARIFPDVEVSGTYPDVKKEFALRIARNCVSRLAKAYGYARTSRKEYSDITWKVKIGYDMGAVGKYAVSASGVISRDKKQKNPKKMFALEGKVTVLAENSATSKPLFSTSETFLQTPEGLKPNGCGERMLNTALVGAFARMDLPPGKILPPYRVPVSPFAKSKETILPRAALARAALAVLAFNKFADARKSEGLWAESAYSLTRTLKVMDQYDVKVPLKIVSALIHENGVKTADKEKLVGYLHKTGTPKALKVLREIAGARLIRSPSASPKREGNWDLLAEYYYETASGKTIPKIFRPGDEWGRWEILDVVTSPSARLKAEGPSRPSGSSKETVLFNASGIVAKGRLGAAVRKCPVLEVHAAFDKKSAAPGIYVISGAGLGLPQAWVCPVIQRAKRGEKPSTPSPLAEKYILNLCVEIDSDFTASRLPAALSKCRALDAFVSEILPSLDGCDKAISKGRQVLVSRAIRIGKAAGAKLDESSLAKAKADELIDAARVMTPVSRLLSGAGEEEALAVKKRAESIAAAMVAAVKRDASKLLADGDEKKAAALCGEAQEFLHKEQMRSVEAAMVAAAKREASKLLASGKYDAAARLYRKALPYERGDAGRRRLETLAAKADRSKSADDLLKKAQALRARGKLKGAQDCLKRIASRYPDAPAAKTAGQLAARIGAEARKAAIKLLAEARKLEESKKPGSALAKYKKIAAEFPDQPEAAEANRRIAFIDRTYIRKAKELIRRGDKADEKEEYPQAKSRYAEAIKVALDLPQAGEAKKKRDALEEKTKKLINSKMSMAKSYERSQYTNLAVKFYKEAIEIDPTSPEAAKARSRIKALK